MPFVLDLMEIRMADATVSDLKVYIIVLQTTAVKAEGGQVTTVIPGCPA